MQNLVFHIRLEILEQMNRLAADYHQTTPVGQKLHRMEQDVDQVAELGSARLSTWLKMRGWTSRV